MKNKQPKPKPYKGISDIKLNWDAVNSFISDVVLKENITAKELDAALAQKAKQQTYKQDKSRQGANTVPQNKISHDKDNKTSGVVTISSVKQASEPIHIKSKESLEDIAEDIVAFTSTRRKSGVSAAMRVHCVFDGKDDFYWFTSDLVNFYKYPELKRYGHFVPKNSDIAIRMQTTELGNPFSYPHWNEIKRYVNSEVCVENRSDFQNQTIGIAGDDILYQYRDIHDFLEALKENREDIIEVESKIQELKKQMDELKELKDTAHKRGQITKSIKDLQAEYRILTQQQEDLKNITIYIRKQSEMRYSLIVDPIQTRIKTQNIFDGISIIIDGGPGTGKSTTMIHRLAYLTDLFAINEDEKNKTHRFNLNAIQRNQLRKAIDSQRDWMFFSPSKLLKDYLAEAMKKEGLKNTSQKVWNWKEYLTLILQENYHLLEISEGDAPFKVCNLTGTLFYQNSGIIDEFTKFYLGQLQEIKSKLPKLEKEEKVYAWTAIAQGIEKKLEGSENYNMPQFISLFNSLEYAYGDDCKELLREKNAAIRDMSFEICELLDKNKKVKAVIEDLFDITTEQEDTIYAVEESDEIVAEDKVEESSTNRIISWFKSFGEDKERKEQKTYDNRLSVEIQKWIKSFCYFKTNNDNQLSDVHQMMSDELLPILGDAYDSQFKKIGELIVFEQFAQYTRGVKAIMLNGIPAKYKKFRSHIIKTKFDGCNLRLLRDVMQRKQGKELHHQEQSLLLGFINSLVKLIMSIAGTNIRHTYIEAYEEVARPIIGVDEATDFCACDIYAMQSLLSRDFFSLTLCGDMMQRMTPHGIKSWKELDNIVPNPKVVDLKTSYRQSKKILELAREMYIDDRGEPPSYRAFMKSSRVPSPLAYVNDNELPKIEWISKRISEVYRAYGEQLPSIAIFVNDFGYIPRFIEALQKTEFFTKNRIKVLDGINDTLRVKENHICVYPIDSVKGMEFDVVFFHDIDKCSNREMINRYIYVGVSRAAFFLAITLSENNKEISKYFEQNKDWFKI